MMSCQQVDSTQRQVGASKDFGAEKPDGLCCNSEDTTKVFGLIKPNLPGLDVVPLYGPLQSH